MKILAIESSLRRDRRRCGGRRKEGPFFYHHHPRWRSTKFTAAWCRRLHPADTVRPLTGGHLRPCGGRPDLGRGGRCGCHRLSRAHRGPAGGGKLCQRGSVLAQKKPLIPVHHIRSHIAANYIEHPDLVPPSSAWWPREDTAILSRCGLYRFRIVGRTRDDAAGEAL